jgi:heat shock protein HslJ
MIGPKLHPVVAATLAGGLLAACATYQARETHERRLIVAPDPVPCADGAPGSCLRVTDPEGDSWITHLDEIEGFAYEPGYAYELLVEEASEVAEIEAGTPPRLRLIRIVSKEASGQTPTALGTELGQTGWRLETITPSGNAPAQWAASGITARFDVWGGRLTGFAGCNNYSAALTVAGDQMTVSPPASTRKACPSQTVMALEQEYLERVAQTTAFELGADRLELSLADGSGMAFRPERP